MKNYAPKVLALASAGLLSAAIAAPTQAYVMASSIIDMTNFRILGSSGNILDAAGVNTAAASGDLATLTFTSSAGMTVELGGNSLNDPSDQFAPIDYAPICLGSACNVIVDNAFPQLAAPPVGNYATSDQLELGAPVANLPGFPDPAHVASASYVGLNSGTFTGPDDASGQSDNNLNSSFTFRLSQATGIQFAFDVDAYLQAAVSADEVFPGYATASYQMSFTLTNLSTGAIELSYNPDIFGSGITTASLNAPLPVDIELAYTEVQTSWASALSGLLNTTDLYQLSARIQTNVDAGRVPVPGTLAIFGLGLSLLGLWRRRV